MYKINEIFYSLQGEGYHTGMPALFIRFATCNLRCPFCDTDFSQYQLLTIEQILQTISNHLKPSQTTSNKLPLLVLTGGEPSLQIDEPLLDALHTVADTIAIETNGTNSLPHGIDWITCSPKENSRVILDTADEVKIVFTGQDVEKWRTQIQAQHYFLQPCSMQNTDEVVQYILRHPHWRLSLQTHKYLEIR